MNNSKIWTIIGGFLGFAGVAFGAFGAHRLKEVLSVEMLETYQTGIFYHLIHSVTIIAIALSSKTRYYKSALFFLMGIILFSFSLYVYANTQIRIFAIVTPFGGISFLIGWSLIIYEGVKAVRDK
jgi:uncharacterized membrane protein YgdD (TMEM256/DUF423 family)